MERNSPALAVTGLCKHFGHITALDKVTFSLPQGKYLTIFGRNGAGKTTLLHILASLLKPSSGKIFFGGKDVTGAMHRVRWQIGFISHQSMFYSDLTAAENLYYYGKLYGIKNKDEAVRKNLDRVGLRTWSEYPVRSFSRGMQQRLAIARAFLHRPRYLLLDEPFSGLDQNAVRLLKQMLLEFHTPDHSAVITTHQLSEGWEVANYIAVLDKGKSCFFHSKRDITFREFKGQYEKVQGK